MPRYTGIRSGLGMPGPACPCAGALAGPNADVNGLFLLFPEYENEARETHGSDSQLANHTGLGHWLRGGNAAKRRNSHPQTHNERNTEILHSAMLLGPPAVVNSNE
jgi:hypothetical protein